MELKITNALLSIIVGLLIVVLINNAQISQKLSCLEELEQMEVKQDSTIDLTQLELNKENFDFVCQHYDIAHPEIVYAQAQLESGHFTSAVFKNKNNFLGLYDSRKHDYYAFTHWSECLKGYKNYVQVKWDGNCDYYQFLVNLPYASDPDYTRKVRYLARNY
ncbi:MAG: glucosaminidase domain-containing protein [Bacillota bacterium]|nr:glucosaminidase domain-containing protein [Bacillota bacterium]